MRCLLCTTAFGKVLCSTKFDNNVITFDKSVNDNDGLIYDNTI